MSRILLLFLLGAVVGCDSNSSTATSSRPEPMLAVKQDAMRQDLPRRSEDLTIPARADKLRNMGFDPGRFVAFLQEMPASARQQFLALLDGGPGMGIVSKPGSREAQLLESARMTAEERSEWKAEKDRRLVAARSLRRN